MDNKYHHTADMRPFIISTTNQFGQMFTMFARGVQLIENQLEGIGDGQSNLVGNIHDLSETTLNLSKSLTAYLLNMRAISEWQQRWKSEPQDPRHIKDIWLRTSTTNLRIYCHRYSSAMFKLACALKKTNKEDRSQSISGSESIVDAPLPWTRSNTSIASQGSSMIAHTPESISSLDLSDGDDVENVWQFFGNGTVNGDFIMDGWSSSSHSSGRSYSHW